MEKKNSKFKTCNKIVNIDPEDVSSKENVYDFSVDYSSIGNSDILNIHKYLMTKNNIK